VGEGGAMVAHDLPDLVTVSRINEPGAADEVFLALRVSDSSEVAVRVYSHPIESARDRERFSQEIAALRSLNGQPHVVVIHDAGVSATGHAYVVMDYCASGSLQDHLVTVGRFSPSEVRGIGMKLADTLAEAHEREIYHRNLKPANVLVGPGGEPALTDFGLLTFATRDGDFAPDMPARPRAYTAPEAFLPELMTAPADIYALGATLYALLAGRAPTTADPLAISVDGDSIADLPKVPWELMLVLRRAMALDPRDRFADADEMRVALVYAR